MRNSKSEFAFHFVHLIDEYNYGKRRIVEEFDFLKQFLCKLSSRVEICDGRSISWNNKCDSCQGLINFAITCLIGHTNQLLR